MPLEKLVKPFVKGKIKPDGEARRKPVIRTMPADIERLKKAAKAKTAPPPEKLPLAPEKDKPEKLKEIKEKLTPEEKPAKLKKPKKRLILILVILIFLVGGGYGLYYWFSRPAAPKVRTERTWVAPRLNSPEP